jgi:uracil-DNA glycosylase
MEAVDIHSDHTPLTWKDLLAEEKEQSYFKEVMAFVESERRAGKTIYPANNEIFHALAATPFDQVKVVILGQDPYHGPNQAHGLCFSVKPGVPFPPSLQNIFKELASDLSIPTPNHGHLESWAKQGVLLLNAVLTVEEGQAGSHANKGWERFTDKIIREINDKKSGVVFLLWGSYAQKKGEFINSERHHVLKSVHPSPLSAHRGFLGCRHFSKTNTILKIQGKQPVNWELNSKLT